MAKAATTPIIANGVVGGNALSVITTADVVREGEGHKPGTVAAGSLGKRAVYVTFGGDVAGTEAVPVACVVDSAFEATAGAGTYNAYATFALGEEGWVFEDQFTVT